MLRVCVLLSATYVLWYLLMFDFCFFFIQKSCKFARLIYSAVVGKASNIDGAVVQRYVDGDTSSQWKEVNFDPIGITHAGTVLTENFWAGPWKVWKIQLRSQGRMQKKIRRGSLKSAPISRRRRRRGRVGIEDG